MGLASIIMGLLCVSLAWLPGVGFLGLVLGLASGILGLLVVTRREAKAGHWQFGVAGSLLAIVGTPLSCAYQLKYWAAAWPMPLTELYPLGAALGLALAIIGFAAGAVVGRFKNRSAGIGVGSVAFIAICVMGAWSLTLADREYMRSGGPTKVPTPPIAADSNSDSM